jgi:hypothetical protein
VDPSTSAEEAVAEVCCPTGPAERAVVGTGRDEEARLRSEGRDGRFWSAPLIEYALARMVAFETEDRKERPRVAVALIAESP